MKIILFFCLFFTTFLSWTQWKNESFDLGTLTESSRRFVDIELKNPLNEKVYVLRVAHQPELSKRLSSDLIAPNGSITLRIQVNSIKKGRFNYTVLVYISTQQEPIEYTISGENTMTFQTGNPLTQCPDFNQTPPNNANQAKKITIITIDKETGERLGSSKVSIIHNGIPAGTWITGSSGAFKETFPPGYFYFLVSHEAYANKEDGVYVNANISEITIPLVRTAPRITTPEPIETEAVKLPEELAKVELDNQLKPEIDSSALAQIPELTTIPPSNFSTDYFKNLNVTFVLDVSSSMKMGEKMDLLKYALNQLVSTLRTDDVMGIVTYANTAQVFKGQTSGVNKGELLTSIEALKPLGMTAGGKGIKLGYKQVLKTYQKDKANMVIIITDGAFNKDSDDYQKTVKKYAKKGIVFSVVGIQTREKDASLMLDAASFGKGRYIPINKLADAHTGLVNEIRIATFKK
jgi:Ca-activated chloride channel family protein